MPRAAPDFVGILTLLRDRGVDLIVVGGTGAVLSGAPIVTWDVDVVPSREPLNLDRLHASLVALEAIYRDPAGRRLVPQREHLAGPGHHLLRTPRGDLDVLGTIGEGLTYADLLPDSEIVEIDPGVEVRVLSLARLIELKRAAGRPKDLAMMHVLQHTLALAREREKG